jgi:hypothetical protein
MAADRRALVALLALAAIGCTHLPWHPYRGWQVLAGEHVVLYTDTLKEHELAYQYLVDSYEVLQRTFFRNTPAPPMHVFYVSPGNDTPLRTSINTKKFGATFARLPGVTVAGGRHLMTVGRYPDVFAYTHLVTHHFVETTMPGAPPWLHEGLALYLSAFRSHPQRADVLCFGLLEPTWLQTRTTINLRRLLDTSWDDFHQTSGPWLAPTAWGMIDYLLHGEGGQLRQGFRPLLIAFAGGLSGQRALRAAFPDRSLADLDAGLADHVRSWRPPGAICPLPVSVARLPAGVHLQSLPQPQEAPETDVRSVFEALERLPHPRGYADFYPAK